MPKINIDQVNAGLSLISTVIPQLTAAYAAYRIIWGVSHPGGSEEDFLAHLTEVSQKNVDEADAILMAHGYVRDPATGNWSKPSGQ